MLRWKDGEGKVGGEEEAKRKEGGSKRGRNKLVSVLSTEPQMPIPEGKDLISVSVGQT